MWDCRAYPTERHDGDTFRVMADTMFGQRYEPALRLQDVRAPELREASAMIEELKDQAHKLRAAKWAQERAEREAARKAVVTVDAGIYLLNGVVHKVQKAVHGSGNMYAKVLQDGAFVYAPGAIRSLLPEHRMTLEQAKEYGQLYGVCCNCGATLTDEKSIEAGIGPVCARKFR